MKRVSLYIREFTIEPIIALLLLTEIYFHRTDVLAEKECFQILALSLGVLPFVGFLLCKKTNKKIPQNIAFFINIMAYFIGATGLFYVGGNRICWLILLVYLLSWLLLIVLNDCFKFNISGHSCGVANAVAISMVLKMDSVTIIFAFILSVVCIASKYCGRHTISQLLGGILVAFSFTGILAFGLVV